MINGIKLNENISPNQRRIRLMELSGITITEREKKRLLNESLSMVEIPKNRTQIVPKKPQQEPYQDEIDLDEICSNPNAIDLIKRNLHKVDWMELSGNPNAINLLTENEYRIDWDILSSNPNGIKLLERYPHKIQWYRISSNPNAIKLLENRIEYEKTLNSQEYSKILYEDKINWERLSANPNAIDLLKNNKDKINWEMLSSNPAIFKAV